MEVESSSTRTASPPTRPPPLNVYELRAKACELDRSDVTTFNAHVSPPKRQFYTEVIRELMVLSPEVTRAQLIAMKDSDKLEKFKQFCDREGLRDINVSHIRTLSALDETFRTIKSCFRFVLTSTAYFVLLSKRLIRCTKRIQRFVRLGLQRRRLVRSILLEKWKEAETVARRAVRAEIECRAARSRSQVSQRSVEDMWDLYTKCWVSREDMVSAIDHLWHQHRSEYLVKYREWKAKLKANLVHGPHDTITKKRHREMKAYSAYPKLVFSAPRISVMEMIAHLDLLQQQKILQTVNSQSAYLPGRKVKEIPKTVAPANQLVSPISMYHALIEFDPKQFYYILFLNHLVRDGALKLPPGPTPSIREQAAAAKETYNRWCGSSPLLSIKPPAAPKRQIGPDGQPVSAYSFSPRTRKHEEAGVSTGKSATSSQLNAATDVTVRHAHSTTPAASFSSRKSLMRGGEVRAVSPSVPQPGPSAPQLARSTEEPDSALSAKGLSSSGAIASRYTPRSSCKPATSFDEEDAEKRWAAARAECILRRPVSAKHTRPGQAKHMARSDILEEECGDSAAERTTPPPRWHRRGVRPDPDAARVAAVERLEADKRRTRPLTARAPWKRLVPVPSPDPTPLTPNPPVGPKACPDITTARLVFNPVVRWTDVQ
jgi:hypothetical protein